MAKTFVMGTLLGFQTLTSKQGKVYGYNMGISAQFINKYNQLEHRITDVRYSDQIKNDVERMAVPLIGKEVYVEVYVSADEYNGKVRVQYNYQRDSVIVDTTLADPNGNALKVLPASSQSPDFKKVG